MVMSSHWQLCIVYCCCSVIQLCSTLCDPMDCSMPGFSGLHCLSEFAQAHVHWVGDAIQPSLCPLLMPSIFPASESFSSKSALHIRWPKYCSFSFSISPSNQVPDIFWKSPTLALQAKVVNVHENSKTWGGCVARSWMSPPSIQFPLPLCFQSLQA